MVASICLLPGIGDVSVARRGGERDQSPGRFVRAGLADNLRPVHVFVPGVEVGG